MTKQESSLASAATRAATITVLYITAVTVAADLWLPLKDFFKTVFTHHWIGKGVTATVLFLLLTALFRWTTKTSSLETLSKNLRRLVTASGAGAVVILFFFLYEQFLK